MSNHKLSTESEILLVELLPPKAGKDR